MTCLPITGGGTAGGVGRTEGQARFELNSPVEKYRPCPAYRPPGVSWLGDLPEHWKARRLKANVFDVINTADHRKPSEGYITLEQVESWTGKISEPQTDVSFEARVKRLDAATCSSANCGLVRRRQPSLTVTAPAWVRFGTAPTQRQSAIGPSSNAASRTVGCPRNQRHRFSAPVCRARTDVPSVTCPSRFRYLDHGDASDGLERAAAEWAEAECPDRFAARIDTAGGAAYVFIYHHETVPMGVR